MIAEWVAEEFSSIDFRDKRLAKRLKISVSALAKIGESTPDSCLGAGELKGMYRLVDNDKVGFEQIFEQHREATIKRCVAAKSVFLLSDTTEVDLSKPQMVIEGAGPLGTGKRKGFYFHPSYAVSDQGVPLGLVDHVIWTRDPESLKVPSKERVARRYAACLAEKESCRWLEIQQNNEQLARSEPDTHFIMVADSEADMGDLLCECDDFPDNFDLIIRACSNHRLVDAKSIDESSIAGEPIENAEKLDDALRAAPIRFEKTIDVPARPESKHAYHTEKKNTRNNKRSAHAAVLSIRTIELTLAGSRRPGGGRLADSRINVVELYEENPPEGDEPIRWVLYTTLPINTLADVNKVIDGYTKRWLIEVYFKTLKSGLNIEDMKYQTLKRYLAAFAMLVVVGWRVEYLKMAAREDPEAPCDKYFAAEQWVPIVTFVKKKKIDPKSPPTMSQFLVMIAKLGGYINKKQQGPPGARTIWRGLKRTDAIVQAFHIFNDLTCGV